jgi:hypothetical protein
MLRPVAPIPIATAPGFEDFADNLLDSEGAESIVWTPSAGDPVPLRAVVRFGAQSMKAYGGQHVTWNPVRMVMVSAVEVQGILPEDGMRVRGADYRIAPGGIHPDGVAMVRIDLTEAL